MNAIARSSCGRRTAGLVIAAGGWLVLVTGLLTGRTATGTAEVTAAVAALRDYDYGRPRAPLDALDRLVRSSHADPALRSALELECVRLLESNVNLATTQELCRRLAVIGTVAALPALSRLLEADDVRVVEAGCYALRTQPAPEADAAVRRALDKAAGDRLVALINVVRDRRDAMAEARLAELTRHDDDRVAEAALTALGALASPLAQRTLGEARAGAAPKHGYAATLALLEAGRRLAAGNQPDEARRVFARLTSTNEPAWVRRGALAGQIALGGSEAAGLILGVVREGDDVLVPVAIAGVASVEDPQAIRILAGELDRLDAPAQVLMTDALGRFREPTVVAALARAAAHPEPAVRVAAIRALSRAGDGTTVPTLIPHLASPLPDEARAAATALRALRGEGVTAALLAALPSSASPVRGELIAVLGDRKDPTVVPALLVEARNPDAAVTRAAFRALGPLAGPQQLPQLIDALVNLSAEGARADAERAVAAVAGRMGDTGASADPVVAALEIASSTSAKVSILRVLGAIGTAPAYDVVSAALDDPETALRDAALRTLADWPDARPVPRLLALLDAGMIEPERTIALRGCLRLLAGNSGPGGEPGQRLDGAHRNTGSPGSDAPLYARLMRHASSPADKTLLLSGLAQGRDPETLRLIEAWLEDPAVRGEAALAALSVARALPLVHAEAITRAMRKVANATPDAALRAQASSLIVPPRPDLHLDELKPVRAKSGNGSGSTMAGRNCIGDPLRVQGVTFARGIGEHAKADLEYALEPRFTRFVALVGLDDQVGRYHDIRGSSIVRVYCGDRRMAETPILRGAGAWCGLDFEIPAGATTLRIEVDDAGDGIDFDDVNLVNAGFVMGR